MFINHFMLHLELIMNMKKAILEETQLVYQQITQLIIFTKFGIQSYLTLQDTQTFLTLMKIGKAMEEWQMIS